jgi:hypothetical protein
LARALMGALSSACTSMHVDVSAGSCERDMTCGDATATWDQQMGCRLRCILPLADLGGAVRDWFSTCHLAVQSFVSAHSRSLPPARRVTWRGPA